MTTHDTPSTPADPSGLEGIRENLEAVGALLRETAARAAETEARALENEARAVEDHRRAIEVDLLAVNGREVVVVEVKTTLRSEGVTKFLSKLSEFLDWCAEYSGRRILGAVAYLDGAESVTKYAERSGLFVIRATGSSASLLNEPGFEPRVFS